MSTAICTSSTGISDLQEWFVVQVKPRTEKAVAVLLQHKEYEVFLPVYQSPPFPRIRTSLRAERVLFPGYVFGRRQRDGVGLIVTTPGVARIVGYIDHSTIEELKLVESSGLDVRPWPRVENGDRVEVVRGPLRGCQGVCIRDTRRTHLVIEVSLLQRSVSVELSGYDVRPIEPSEIPVRSHFPAGADRRRVIFQL